MIAGMRAGAVCRCSGRYGHECHVGVRSARRAASDHKRGVRAGAVDCRSCRDGGVPQVFRCAADEDIYHWGHR